MLASTSLRDAIVRPGRAEGVLFPAVQQQFLLRQPLSQFRGQSWRSTNEITQASPSEQRIAHHEDPLVRLPSLRESKWKVTVLQRWIGRVEHVREGLLVATLLDATNPRNPPERVELELAEVSESDLPLLAEGATFYWSIGYRDTPGGQRERISTLRVARQPRLSRADLDRIFARSDRLAAFLESD